MKRHHIPLHTFILTILFILEPVCARGQSPFTFGEKFPKHEVRAVWITTIGGLDWPDNYAQSAYSAKRQKRDFIRILNRLQDANINTVLLQTRVRGTTIYPSLIEPWDGCMSGFPGVSPGYDPLLFAIEECHKRGMELHAWIVCMPLGEIQRTGYRHLKRIHPELCTTIKSHGFMRPEQPGTATYLASLCCEIVRNYDIDGIHLDYIRYPEEKRMAGPSDWKRYNITRIVETVSKNVKDIKPWVKMSCSPIGKYRSVSRYDSHGWNAYDVVYQDAQGWLRDGLMDALFPMMYFKGNNFYPFAADWKENSYGKIVAPGLAAYFMSRKEKNWPLSTITTEMNVLRSFGMGHSFFRCRHFINDLKGIYNSTRYDIDLCPALIPPMTWMERTAPSAPKVFMKEYNGTQMLSWTQATNHNDSPYLSYNIYRSKDYPVNTDDPRNLVAIRIKNMAMSFSGQYHYAVTAVDRYGQESKATQVKRKK